MFEVATISSLLRKLKRLHRPPTYAFQTQTTTNRHTHRQTRRQTHPTTDKYRQTQTHTMTDQIRIPNVDNYTIEIIAGVLILTPKQQFITENELNMTDVTHSTIESCVVKKGDLQISTRTNYRSVLVDIWTSMPAQKILRTTSFNFKLTNESGERGYNWCPDIGMSFQSKCASGTLKEILSMTKVNKYTIEMSIKLETGRIIQFKIE